MEYLYTKLIILSSFSSLLLILFLNTKFHYIYKKFSKIKKIFINSITFFLLIIILFFVNYQTYLLGLFSLLIFNAALITVVFFEMAIYLERTFWDDFLGNSLPRSINLLISFVVMMNFGYFTLMFYIKILGVNYFLT